MRKSVAAKRIITVSCSECGKPLSVGANTRKPKRCVECGIDRMIKHNAAMVEKSGPDYEKWHAARIASLQRELSATLPLPANNVEAP